MASIKTGAGISTIRGKVGDTIFSRNRGGAYSKAWAAPGTPATPDQTDKEDIWIDMGAAWAGMSYDDNELWRNYADQLTHKNRIGDPIQLTAYQVFVECYTNARLIGFTPLTVPSSTTNRPAVTGNIELTVLSNGTDLDRYRIAGISGQGGDGNGMQTLVYAAPCMRPTIRNVDTYFRLITMVDCDPSPVDILTSYTTKFGTAGTPGQLAHIRLRNIDRVSMLGSTRAIFQTLVTT